MSEDYIGVISNYNRGLWKQRTDRCLIKVRNVEKSIARRLIGYKVMWPKNNPKILGKIIKTHGATGTLLVKFEKGIPGQALGTEVNIMK